MKKITVLLISICLCSCLGTKKVFDKNTSKTENTTSEITNDSVSNKITSLPINDRVIINVPKTDNAELMQMFNGFLQQFNTSKTSGLNSYSSRYDEKNNQVVIDFVVAATEKLETIINKESKVEKSFEEKTDEYISKKVTAIPWWVWVALVVWFLPQILSRVQLLINPVSGFVSQFKK